MKTMRKDRRRFLGWLAAVPGAAWFLGGGTALGQAAGGAASSVAAGPGGVAGVAGRDVIAELGVRSFINAAGTFTAMTGSLMGDEVLAAMKVASTKYVMLEELQKAVGDRIAQRLQCEAALVTAGCASALSVATAACVAGADRDRIRRIPDTTGMKNQVVIQRSHRVGYDHAVRNAGVTMVEVETATEMEAAINDRTAMMFFLNAASDEGQVKHEQFVEIAKRRTVPTLIDAAADVPPVENLWRFTKMGFDLVAFSGGKGLRGPQSAGLLLGRRELIEAGRMNMSPHGDTLCRTNKVNKEEIIGMLVALERFLDQDHAAVWKEWERRCEAIAAAVRDIPTVNTEVRVPSVANAVPHLHVTWDYEGRSLTARQAVEKLRNGTPSIEVNPGSRYRIVVGVWMMREGDAEVVAKRLREVLAG